MSQKRGRRSQPHYPVEVKRAALDRLEAGESVASIALALGCPQRRIYYWQEQWRRRGEGWAELKHRHRQRRRPPPGSAERTAELERLVGQQQADLDFLREALRRIEQARQPIVGRGAPSPGSSLRPRQLVRKAR